MLSWNEIGGLVVSMFALHLHGSVTASALCCMFSSGFGGILWVLRFPPPVQRQYGLSVANF